MARTEKVILEFDVDNSKVSKLLNELKGKASEVGTAFKSFTDTASKALKSVADRATDISKRFKVTEKAVNALRKGFQGVGRVARGFGNILKGLGIGAIISLFATLQGAFEGNQKAADFFNTTLETVSILFNKLLKAVEPVFDVLKKLFTRPQEAIDTFKRKLENIQNYFNEKVVPVFSSLGDIITNLFDSEERNKAIERFKNAFNVVYEDAAEVVNKVVDATVESIKEAAKEAQVRTNLTKVLELQVAQQQLITLEYQKQQESLRQIRDDENNTFAERTAANEALIKSLQEQLAQETAIANKQIEVAQRRLKDDPNNIALQKELIAAKTALADVEERINGQLSEALSNVNSLRNEQIALNKERIDTNNQLADIEFQKQQIQENSLLTQIENEKKFFKEQAALREQALLDEIAKYKEGSTIREQLENEYLILKAQNSLKELELDKQTKDQLKANEEQLKAFRIQTAQTAFSALVAIADALEATGLVNAKRAFQVNKALGISEAIINGVLAVQKTLKEPAYPAPLNIIAAAAMGVTTAANVAKIASQKFEASGSLSVATPNIPSAPSATEPRANVNLADIIGQQERPVKAYVVATDVSNAQEANKKIKNQNTL